MSAHSSQQRDNKVVDIVAAGGMESVAGRAGDLTACVESDQINKVYLKPVDKYQRSVKI